MRDHFGNQLLSSDLNFAKGIKILDDCEGTCNWIMAATDANATGTFETAAAWTGLKGLQLFSGDATPAENDFVAVNKMCDLPESGLLVFRTKVCSPDISLVKTIEIYIIVSIDSVNYSYLLEYDPNTPIGKYYTEDASLVDIQEFAISIIDNTWFSIELVIDAFEKKYISASMLGTKKSLAGISPEIGGAATVAKVSFYMKITTAGAAAATAFFDNIYLGEYENV